MNYQHILVRLLRNAKGPTLDTWQTQCAVLAGQLGQYARAVYHTRAYPREEAAHKVEAVRAIGDLVIQCQITCTLLNVDFDRVVENAYHAFINRMEDIKKRRLDTT